MIDNTTMHEGDIKARRFLQDTKAVMSFELIAHDKYFPSDTASRDIYEITIKRDKKEWIFKFGQSIAKSGIGVANAPADDRGQALHDKESWTRLYSGMIRKKRVPPTEYSVLAAITKHDPGSYDEFCADYGYDRKHKESAEIYLAVQREFANVMRMFGDAMDALREID